MYRRQEEGENKVVFVDAVKTLCECGAKFHLFSNSVEYEGW